MTPVNQYPFRLAFTNPLFDPITISLSILPPIPLLPRPSTTTTTTTSSSPTSTSAPAPSKPPFHISLPLTSFPVSAFADPWEYGLDGEDEDIDALLEGTAAAEPKHSRASMGRKSGVHGREREKEVLLERRGNVTEVGMEVRVGRGAREGSGLDVSDLSILLVSLFFDPPW